MPHSERGGQRGGLGSQQTDSPKGGRGRICSGGRAAPSPPATFPLWVPRAEYEGVKVCSGGRLLPAHWGSFSLPGAVLGAGGTLPQPPSVP